MFLMIKGLRDIVQLLNRQGKHDCIGSKPPLTLTEVRATQATLSRIHSLGPNEGTTLEIL
jgi:hypothetical protein